MKMSSLAIMHEKRSQLLLVMPLLIMYSSTILGQKLASQEATDSDPGTKCGSCPCANPCGQPSPPPPRQPPPPPPPAAAAAANTVYCTPPPPRFVYVTNQPGNFYGADPYDFGFYNGAGQNIATWSLLLFAFGVVNVVMI